MVATEIPDGEMVVNTSTRAALALTLLMAIGQATAAVAAQPGISYDRDVVYGHKAGMALTYDVLRPAKPNGAGVIMMVSGGWFSSWQPPEQRAARLGHLLGPGFTVFAVHHGSAPRFKVPEALSDVRAAVRHIKRHAKEYAVDPGRLGVFGGSAGGHLALMLGLSPEVGPDVGGGDRGARSGNKYHVESADDASVAAVVAYYPPTDLRQITGPNERFPALDFAPELADSVSPVLFATKDDPPVKLIHGTADALVPLASSEALREKLVAAGVKHNLMVIEGGNHGFREGDDRKAAAAAMAEWFSQHLKEK